MKKKLFFTTLLLVCVGVVGYYATEDYIAERKRRAYAEYLSNHEYSKRENLTGEELKKVPKKDRPDLAWEQDFLRTMDPNLKRIPTDRLIKAIETTNELRASKRAVDDFNWVSRGPKQVSGRIRAFMFDPNDTENKKAYTGGVSGGIWVNSDITNANSPWTQVEVSMSNFAISAMDYDPTSTSTFYAGTGEGWGNVDAVRGGGIWKSTNSGRNWSNLASTVSFEYVYDLIVRDEKGAGVIYAAMRDVDGISSQGTDLLRSTDGGATWTIVSTVPVRDLELSADNTIWAGTASGEIYSSPDGTTWNLHYTSSLDNAERVELATAPSNANVVYALVEDANAFGELVKTSNAGASFGAIDGPSETNDSSIQPDDFTRGQAWYDFIIEVHPTNENEIYVGGVNSYKSSDSGTNWTKISSWDNFRDNTRSYVHADIHNIVFRPGNNNEMVITSDGGVSYCPDVTALPLDFDNGIFNRNVNLNLTQYYSGAVDPVDADISIGGTQDNGTQLLSTPAFGEATEIWGGDGGFCFIDQTHVDGNQGLYRIVSNTRNTYYLLEGNDWTRIQQSSGGSFINPADYDDDNNILYSSNGTSLSVTTLLADGADQGSGTTFNGTNDEVTLVSGTLTHIRVSPYNPDNRTVYIGSQSGDIIKRTAGTNTFISNPGVPNASVSCIEVGASDDELLVTYSNYGELIANVWYSTDGGASWQNKEGNLPDMPVRWALFNPLDRKEVILATEVGMWQTSDITANSVTWTPISDGMGNVRVDMLQYRPDDNLVLAATHGRGMFTANFTANTASIDEVLRDEKIFTVYPTISKGDFTVFGKNELGKTKIEMFDISGRNVFKEERDFTRNRNQKVNVNLSSGIYIVNIVDENNRKSSRKVIIE